MVVGAGALGNEVLKNLALLGLGEIHLIDFDKIDESNLTRSVLFRAEHAGQPKSNVAAEMAMQLNPDCRIVPQFGNVLTEIGLGLVRDMDLVICCVDNREARLWINRMCWKVNTPWIDGGIQEINGVAKVFVPPDGSCYECAMTENDYRLISLRYSCPLLKQEDIQRGRVPTAPTIASIIGGLQVQEALKLIHELPAAKSTALVFNGAANKFYQTRYPRREDCLSHETYEEVLEVPLTANESTVADLMNAVAQSANWPDSNDTPTDAAQPYETEPNEEPETNADEQRHTAESLTLILDRDFLIGLNCPACDITKPIEKPLCEVGSSEGVCESCNQPLLTETVCEIDRQSPLADKTLKTLGVPDYDIVKVASDSKTVCVLLANDQSKSQDSTAKTE